MVVVHLPTCCCSPLLSPSINSPTLSAPIRIKTPPPSPFPSVSSLKRSNSGSARAAAEVGGDRESRREEKSAMTITPAVRVSDRKLVVKDRPILTNVPDKVVATYSSTSGPVEGVFLGAAFDEKDSRHVVPLGNLLGVRFMACFRFMLWWMAQKMGDRGRDIPLETQFMLVETKDESGQIIYTVFLPLIEGPFRACLQGNSRDELELCLESGDAGTTSDEFTHSVYITAGTDPFKTIAAAVEAVKSHLKTFRQRHEKKLPGFVDYFGWCTWDAFYQEVTQEGVESGLRSLTAGRTPPKFVIIDDGWQSVGSDEEREFEPTDNQPSSLLRLTGIKENRKFQNKEDPTVGIKNIVSIAKEKYGLKYVYMWHAICGYWGGVRPGVKEMEQYGSSIRYPMVSKGVVENEPAWKTAPVAVQGLGLVDPRNVDKFYGELHGYLAGAGVDGVKVDGQCILETVGAGLGGRVDLTRIFHQALDASISRNFPDNGCIACMCHNTDAIYRSKQTAVVRASDDFFPRDPVSHTILIAAVAYNSLFLGEFMQPDWDMFHSLHPAAEYHASARAISGGPVYVSDAPGNHDFDLLKKLVLPDGSILRARLPGRPTQDCLFTDPARDNVSLLKIWNMNKYTGVLGVYNCQGAAWSTTEKKYSSHQTGSEAITGFIRARDIHLIGDVAVDPDWNGECAIYSHRDSHLITLPYNDPIPISLKVLEQEIFTVTPIKVLAPGFSFAPLGLIDMFNAGGAIEGLKYEVKGGAQLSELEDGYKAEGNELSGERMENLSVEVVAMVRMEVKGCGRFGAYSSAKPRKCTVGSTVVEFEYDPVSGLISLNLDYVPQEDQKFHIVMVEL